MVRVLGPTEYKGCGAIDARPERLRSDRRPDRTEPSCSKLSLWPH